MPYSFAEILTFLGLLVLLWFIVYRLVDAIRRARVKQRPPEPPIVVEGEIVELDRDNKEP